MEKTVVVLKNETGLHARPAATLIKMITKFNSHIEIEKDEKSYNAKSIMSLLSMGAQKGDKLVIKADGDDAVEAIEVIRELMDKGFDE